MDAYVIECKDRFEKSVAALNECTEWTNDSLYKAMTELAKKEGLKNGQILWPIRTALSGKAATPCGASELAELLGKEETCNIYSGFSDTFCHGAGLFCVVWGISIW